MTLVIVIFMTVGGVPWGTEFWSHLIRNVSGGSIHNVFVLLGLFILWGSYNKVSHAMHQDCSMACVPVIEAGRLWI